MFFSLFFTESSGRVRDVRPKGENQESVRPAVETVDPGYSPPTNVSSNTSKADVPVSAFSSPWGFLNPAWFMDDEQSRDHGGDLKPCHDRLPKIRFETHRQ